MHARVAGLMALSATLPLFSAADCATRILPALAPLCIDPEAAVRDSGENSRGRPARVLLTCL